MKLYIIKDKHGNYNAINLFGEFEAGTKIQWGHDDSEADGLKVWTIIG